MTQWFDIKGVLVAALGILVLVLYLQNSMLKSSNKDMQLQIAGYDAAIASYKVQAAAKQETAKEAIKNIEYRTQEKIKIIKEYVYDNNQSECANAIASMRLTM